MAQKVFSYTKTTVWTWWSTYVILHLVKKSLVLVINQSETLYGWGNLQFSTIFRPFWGLFNAWVTHIGIKKKFQYTKMIFGTWRSTHVIFNLVNKPLGLVKNDPQRKYCQYSINIQPKSKGWYQEEKHFLMKFWCSIKVYQPENIKSTCHSLGPKEPALLFFCSFKSSLILCNNKCGQNLFIKYNLPCVEIHSFMGSNVALKNSVCVNFLTFCMSEQRHPAECQKSLFFVQIPAS